MNRLSAGILSAAALAGLGGSTVAYAWASAGNDAPTVARPAARDQARPSVQHSTQKAPVRWAPCVAPAHLEQGVCVTDVVHTIVVPAPAAPSAPAVPAAPGTPAAVARTGAPATAAAEPRDDAGDEPGDDRAGDGDGDHREGPNDDDAARAVAPRTR
jgi:hypothetical protein